MKKILLGLFAFALFFGAVSFTSNKAQAENIFTRSLFFGSKGEDVKALQEVLKNEGLLSSAATGFYGPLTKEAVTQLQAKNNLEPVGVVGPKTLALVTTKASTVDTTTSETRIMSNGTGGGHVITNKTVSPTTTVSTCVPTSAPSITVISPNGGEVYQAGQQTTVTWTSCNVPATANINIGLSMGSTSIASTAGATSNDGSEVITLPTQANLPIGTYMNYGLNFKVNLFVSGMALFDSSNNLFTINNNGTTTIPCLNTIMGTPIYSTTNTNTPSSSITSVTYNIPLTVTSVCQTLYLGQSAQLSAIATASSAFSYAFENASSPTTLNTTSSASATLISNDAVIQDKGYRLDNGITKHFTLSVNLITPSILNSSYRVKLNQIRTFTNSLLSTGATNQNLIPEANYRTGYQFINN